jgi:hypothetical protein
MQTRLARRRRRAADALGCVIVLALLVAAGAVFWQMPFVRDRLEWRVALFTERVRDTLAPQAAVLPTLNATRAAPPSLIIAASTATPSPAPTDPIFTATPTPPPTSTPTPIVLPPTVTLTGARYEPQLFNNCGPATLTAALVFWGWRGAQADSLKWYGNGVDVRWQKDVAAVIKPDFEDRNVTPHELAAFARQVGLSAIIRYGGDLDRVRVLVANGFPVILERAFLEAEHEQEGLGWEGHYSLVTGYDDEQREFITQDSFKGPNYRRGYEAVALDWRAFNYAYVVLASAEREAELLALLGADADEQSNHLRALSLAQSETQTLTDPEQLAFAWHNAGVSLHYLGRDEEAAAAFDQARGYNTLPWRMLWYQHEMYAAYFGAGRHQDIIDLATALVVKPGLEESYYWRARAHYALGNTQQAEADLREALRQHTNWGPARARMKEWGMRP